MIKVGDWVTQYYKGYWMVVRIIPKYSNNSDYTNEDNAIKTSKGNWVLMKKGFTPKMVFRLDSSYCDEAWCHPVTLTQKKMIDRFFEEHPYDYLRFTNYEYVDRPAIASVWIDANPEEERRLRLMLSQLPPLFTNELFFSEIEKWDLQRTISKPPANHLLTFEHTVWEIDNNNNPLFKNPRLKSINTN